MRKCGIEDSPIVDPVVTPASADRSSSAATPGDPEQPATSPHSSPYSSFRRVAPTEQAASRLEMARQLAVCYSCRECVAFCAVFPLAFDQIATTDDADPARCTPFQQDSVVDECTFCAKCTDHCTHAATPDSVDIMAMMVQMQAIRLSVGQAARSRTSTRVAATLPGALGRSLLARTCLSAGGCRAQDGSVLGCCGAGELFSGNLAGFERLNDHLHGAVAERLGIGSDVDEKIEVTDPRCARLIRDTVTGTTVSGSR